MSTATPEKRENIADVMKNFGQPGMSMPDMRETIRQVESVKTVKFAFHPWIDLSNFGSDGFKFNIPYAVLKRLHLIPLAVFPYPKITPKASGQFSLLGYLEHDVPSMGSQSTVETLMQMPSVSMRDLHTAYSKFGMQELVSLAAQDEAELTRSFILYESVMGVALDEAELNSGRRPADLVLEDFPSWLQHAAPRALRAALHSVVIQGREYQIDENQLAKGEQLIEEIRRSIARAEEAALSPSDGILTRTKELLNMTANGADGGKTHLDFLDEFLLGQYPSFRMDTDVERAQKAMQVALVSGNEGSREFNTGILAIMQQNQEMLKQQQQTLNLLTEKVMSEPAKPSGAKRPIASTPATE